MKMSTRRPGFSLVELLIALTITAIIGVAMTGLFVAQSRFLELQQKSAAARGISRGATNIMMSEMRMIDRDSGVYGAMDTAITMRVPFAMGIICNATGSSLTFSMLPVDSVMYATGVSGMTSGYGGYAYRQPNGRYNYVALSSAPNTGSASTCTTPGITVMTSEGGTVKTLSTSGAAAAIIGQPVILYQVVRYHFNSSTSVTGRRGLFRWAAGTDEEILAPFDTSAKFGFYVNDAKTPVTSAPSNLATLTGIDLILNSVNEKPNGDGTYSVVPMRTAVFFKNRRN